jgi:hypothetical protein
MKTAPLRIMATVAALAFVVASCGGGGDSATSFGPPEGTDRDFVATSLDGEQAALADYAGQDVMIWFWAPW